MLEYDKLTKFGKKAVNSFYNHTYTGCIITGSFGKGKTTTAIHLAREIIQYIYKLDKMSAYRKILKEHLLFTLDDLLGASKVLKSVDWASLTPQEALRKKFEIRKPVLIFDDCGVHASKYVHFLDMADARNLQSDFDTIRDITSCLIMTVPESEELLKFLRMYRGNYQVEIMVAPGNHIVPNEDGNSTTRNYQRRLEFWKYDKNRIGKRQMRLKWRSQPFSIYIPTEIYGEYEKLRTLAKIKNTDFFEKRHKMKEAQTKYFETRQKYYQLKMDKEMKEMDLI